MARSQELRQEAQAMSDIERLITSWDKLPLKMRGRVLRYAEEACADAVTALAGEDEAAAGQGASVTVISQPSGTGGGGSGGSGSGGRAGTGGAAAGSGAGGGASGGGKAS
jgi:hypothetical protein